MADGTTGRTEMATLGGGCFWCVEAVYERMDGVLSAVSGYAGGETPHPTYEAVCTGRTGHAEVVQVTFDPSRITYQQVLDLFFKAHDPTTLNRQGADAGTQYRSIVLFHNEEQRRVAQQTKERLDATRKHRDPVVTEIVPLEAFYQAEDYHQGYYDRNPTKGYCAAVIAPKLNKLELGATPLSKTRR